MTSTSAVSTRHETPLYVDVDGDGLFGILTRPPGEARDVGVIFLGAGGYMFSAQRNRLPVRTCRGLAAEGFPSLRFDYLGTGDSGGVPPARYRVDQPFIDQAEAAVRVMEGAGTARYVLVGSCFGARTALSAAPTLPGVVGAVLIVPPVADIRSGEGSMLSHLGSGLSLRKYAWEGARQVGRGIVRRRMVRKYLRKAVVGMRLAARAAIARIRRRIRRDPASMWLSPLFVSSVEALVERRVPILFVYGKGDPHLGHFRQAASSGRLAEALSRAGDLVEVRTLPGEIEGFASLEAQETVTRIVQEWVLRRGQELSGDAVTTDAPPQPQAAP